jgi:hypothetical protein
VGDYTGIPTLDADMLVPDRVSVDVPGNAIEGGRNGLGESISIDLSGGGILTASYEDCRINAEKQFEYVNWLGARLNGGFRFINVPIITDWWGLFPKSGAVKLPYVAAVPKADGSLFTTDGGFREATVYGEVMENAAAGAGTVKIKVYRARRDIRWSDWFSFYHETKGWRAYRNWRIISKSDAENPVYELAIQPALRDAISDGDRVEFARPLFVAKFRTGFTLPSVSESFYSVRQSIQFSEAF